MRDLDGRLYEHDAGSGSEGVYQQDSPLKISFLTVPVSTYKLAIWTGMAYGILRGPHRVLPGGNT